MRTPHIIRVIDEFLELVQVSIERNEKVWIGSDFQSRPMFDELDLWTFLSAEHLGEYPGEIVQELSAWLGRAPYYIDQDSWPEGFPDYCSILVEGEPERCDEDIAWVHHATRAGEAIACLCLRKSGLKRTRSAYGDVEVYFVGSEGDRLAFWRNTITFLGDSIENLVRFSDNAYPCLYFYNDVLLNVSHLSGDYYHLRDRVKLVLEVLNDHGVWVFVHPPPAIDRYESTRPHPFGSPSNQLIQQRFSNLGLDVAPEKPSVYANTASRKLREVNIGDETLYCHWHVRLEKHQNRIYIHGPVSESENMVVIAKINEHL